MTDRSAIWERECHGFALYLVGQSPPQSVVHHYVRWHKGAGSANADVRGNRFDRVLIGLARSGRPGLRLADAYASRICRAGLLRKKLILTLALLESIAPTFAIIDRVGSTSRIAFWVGMILRSAWSGIVFVCAFVLLGPLHAACRLAGHEAEEVAR